MTPIDDILGQGVARALGWTLLHFVWQGLVVAAVLAWMLARMRAATANARYLAGCAALATMFVLPIATFVVLANSPSSAPQFHVVPRASTVSAAEHAAGGIGPGESRRESSATSRATWSARVERAFPALLVCWAVGVMFFSVRLVGGWVELQRLRWRLVELAPPEWRRRCEEMAERLGVFRPVWLLESRAIDVPTLIGWLRPAILLPVSALTSLPPREVEALLLHELAHVRRHDYLVNLIQSCMETVLFYHPAVWWVAARVRDERENCCDDLAVAACGDAMDLSRALTRLEMLRGPESQLAMAATGGNLLARVRRLLVPGTTVPPRPAMPGVFALAAAAFLGMAMLVSQPKALAGSNIGDNDAWFAAVKARRMTIDMENARLVDAMAVITGRTGVKFVFPPDAEQDRITVHFADEPVGNIIHSVLNLKEMDWDYNPANKSVYATWWEGSGPRLDDVPVITRAYFEARQEAYSLMKDRISFEAENESLESVLGRLSKQTGLKFTLDGADGNTLVSGRFQDTRTKDVLKSLIGPLGLHYGYTDIGAIRISAPRSE